MTRPSLPEHGPLTPEEREFFTVRAADRTEGQPASAWRVLALRYEATLRELESQVAALAADKERMDWLEAAMATLVMNRSRPEKPPVAYLAWGREYADERRYDLPALRVAIDAARLSSSTTENPHG
jgi:hypothetical protein